MGLIARLALVLGSFVAGWFASPDADNFDILSFVAALFLFTLVVAIAAFWPVLLAWGKRCVAQIKARF
jgi:hypothetical protein